MADIKILFVDDEPNILASLKRALRREPYTCLFADGPDEALDRLRETEIDILVVDYMMPGMTGLTLLKRVRELHPGIVRVILTGNADLQMAIDAINQGEVSRFLTKPWVDAELRVTLQHLVDFIGLRRENQLLTDQVRRQRAFIDKLAAEYPDILEVKRDETGAIVIDLDDYDL